jgi:hypothetical protein
MLAQPAFSDHDKLAAVNREVNMRRRVYPRWIAAGKMTQAAADRQIAVMVAIAADYRAAMAMTGSRGVNAQNGF